MNMHGRILIALGMGFLSFRATGADLVDKHIAAKNVTAEEAAVWKAEDEYWGRSGCCGHENLMDNKKWLDYVSDDAMVWSPGAAGVESKAATLMWEQAQHPYEGKRIEYELFPQAMVIHGNVAIAYYRFRVVSVTKENPDKPNVGQGRYVDVWVRDRPGAPWKYLTWTGGSGS